MAPSLGVEHHIKSEEMCAWQRARAAHTFMSENAFCTAYPLLPARATNTWRALGARCGGKAEFVRRVQEEGLHEPACAAYLAGVGATGKCQGDLGQMCSHTWKVRSKVARVVVEYAVVKYAAHT